jgi:2-polyprenyl-3-methyl-5-hydroxy-6-metoxy-1,4-benzoquinol methylase
MSKPNQPVSPEVIFQAMTAYQETAALKAAIELDVFRAVGEGATAVPELAKRCTASERGMRTLADFLVIMELLTKTGSTYGLTAAAATFLDPRSPAYLGGMTRFMLSPHIVDPFKDVAAAVKKGGSTVTSDNVMAPDHPAWIEFARSMIPMMMPAAQAIAEIIGASKGDKWKVLDVAAGHGMFGVTIAQRNPNAEIHALDWANVLQVAEENAGTAGVADRFHRIPGDALKVELGTDYDVVLITNFLHHFDVPACESFLRKVRHALKPNGRAVTLEFVPNEDRVSPRMPASFSMMMLVGTPGGDAYTLAELEQMFRHAGFSRSESHRLQMSPQQVIVSS